MKQTLKSVVLVALRAYKWVLSPLLPPACRYVPSCSEYAMEAVDRYGVARGLTMAAWRLLRCHPFVKGGFDPVTRVGGTRQGVQQNSASIPHDGTDRPPSCGKNLLQSASPELVSFE
jgi:putative membrane protein insertion efficiency factor